MRMVGQARLSPDEIAAIVGKGKGDKLARHIIAFIKGGDVLKLKPAPYFEPRRRNMMEQTAPVLNPILNYLHEARQEVREWPQEARNFVPIGIIGFISCMALAISLMRLYQGEGDSQTNIMIAIISGIIAAPIGLYMIKIARE
ncbi:hypothetical protein HOE425_280001 [Hoeflea sp. EC-HK425]|nr:hypothetical protein HOE425_280001 [Hoeflea sp. EC-HK425]